MTHRDLPHYKQDVTLVPHSSIQFLDFAFGLDGASKAKLSFVEEPGQPAADGSHRVVLRTLLDRAGTLLHPDTDLEVDPDQSYTINATQSLEPFLDHWVPVPFLCIRGVDTNLQTVFDKGPTNWARACVTEIPPRTDEQRRFHLVLAFDTELDSKPSDPKARRYTHPTLDDAKVGARFAFSAEEREIAAFLNQEWVDQWVESLFHAYMRRRNRRFNPKDLVRGAEHAARYRALLNLIEKVCAPPRVRLVDTVSTNDNFVPIEVDMVIDVGNSRTCGILIEAHPDDREGLELTKSYVLSLRDLSSPHLVHSLPFESRVEFSRPAFGLDGFSRISGRQRAFNWPSLTRIGPEAVRLSVTASGTEGSTGMSSPKRYLWDRRPANQPWLYLDPSAVDGQQERQVTGPLMKYVTEQGDVLRQLKSNQPSAVRPKFSRSSLFTFLMAEAVAQAIGLVNSVESRGRQRNSEMPRKLRRIIMTVPPATPLTERRIMRDRVEGAVKLVWQALGWVGTQDFTPPSEPEVRIAFDEAICTQIVYLYAEITQKMGQSASAFFELLGKERPSVFPGKTLRIASVDIGGGTTDLTVCTYAAQGTRIIPSQQFREGFKIAGDDVLQEIVGKHVLPAIEAHLGAHGLTQGHGFLKGIVGADRGAQSEQERQFRRRFVTQIAVPAGLALLHDYEIARPFADDKPRKRRLGTAFPGGVLPPTAEEFDRRAEAAGAAGFHLGDVEIGDTAAEIANTIVKILGGMLNDFAEVIYKLDCDIILVSGRPSRFPAVVDALLSRVPVRPDRVIAMGQYRVGKWYPFRDIYDRVDDPKTTVAVGALLCTLAAGQIRGFSLDKEKLTIRSTARFVGEMNLDGTLIEAGKVLFADLDLDSQAPGQQSVQVKVDPPITIGFRQLPQQRWPASPLYMVELTNPASAGRLKLPLTITLERADFDPDDPDETKREDFRITEVQDAEETTLRASDVTLRLQTLKSQAGYWLDTGVVDAY